MALDVPRDIALAGRAGAQAPELQQLEGAAVDSDALLPEDDPRSIDEAHQRCDEQQDRAQEQDRERRSPDVHGPLERPRERPERRTRQTGQRHTVNVVVVRSARHEFEKPWHD